MENVSPDHRGLRLLIGFGSLVLVVAAFYFARAVLIPVVLAILLTFILSPLVSWLQHQHIPRVLAVILAVVLACVVVAGVAAVVLSQLQSLAHELPTHKKVIAEKFVHLREASRGSWLDDIYQTIQEVADQVQQAEEAAAGPSGRKTGTGTLPQEKTVVVTSGDSSVMAVLQWLAGPIVGLLVDTALIIVLVIFMLMRREDLRNRVIRLSGEGSVTSMTKALDDAAHRISRFLLVQFLINASFGLAVTVGLFFIGVPYPAVWGFLGGALRYIPYIGAWLAALLPLILTAAVFPDWTPALLVFGLFAGTELVTSNFLEPWLYGQSVGVSEVAMLVAVAFWAWLWGPIGMVLATPLTACLAVLGRYVPHLEFFVVLLGDEPVLKESVVYYQRLLARDEDEATQLVEEYDRQHCGGQVFDEVFIPALMLTTFNRERGKLTQDDERYILETTRELLEEVTPARGDKHPEGCPTEPPPEWEHLPETHTVVFGCPARDEADELTLEMLKQLLDPRKCRLEVISVDVLAAELLERVEKEKPAVVCIASLPPRGLTHARYLCKRLRSRFPELKILVLSLGREGHQQRAEERLREAGADFVTTTLEQCRAQLAPILQVEVANEGQKKADSQAAAAASR